MAQKTCKTCMWHWDLYDTGEYKCYRNRSPFFHEATEKGCRMHEDLVKNRMVVKLGYYKKSK